MRFIIHELPYERPLLAGRLRYERDGAPTGAVESWRLTAAAEGYRFLRVDLDAREAPSGRSFLFHVVLNAIGRPEQLKFRFWGDGHEASGSAVWDKDGVVATRRVAGAAYEDTAHGRAFWFPAGAGLALLAGWAGETSGMTMLADPADPARLMALVETPVVIAWGEAQLEEVAGELLPVRPLAVAWSDQRRTVWLDGEARPIRLAAHNGLTATAERLVRYQN
ncbi:protein of unknown function [Candidatus Promineifilum breve]|uniref:Uncharacterized protein n=1 Tax=Candidatus Promineifilum breve TaxID=1806508 RepID=A0A160SYU9_9CHLR|nr:hypothetical protein [Candidatus Promineifilum breve]CUS02516.2 protein of unknown function [Candidatus Promineifilum breve]